MAISNVSILISGDPSGAINALRQTENAAKQTADAVTGATGRMAAGMNSATGATGRLATALTAASAAAAAMVLFKITEFAKEAAALAARVETLAVVMKVVGNNAGYTGAQMDMFTSGLKKMGITTQESMSSLIKMAGANMDLAKSSQLARVAQDAAVIGGINSSEAFGRMIQGIRSGEVEVLKTIGINVQFEEGYKKTAATLGKTTQELTNAEKTASRMNEVLAFGTNIAGAYEASMTTAGKQMLSMARYTEELKLQLGEAFRPTLTIIINEITAALKGMNEQMSGNEKGVQTFGQQLAGFVSGTLNYFKKDMIQISALLMDMKAGLYLLGSIPAMTGGGNMAKDMRDKADALSAAATAQRDYIRSIKAADNGQPALDPSDQMRLKVAQSRAEHDRIISADKARNAASTTTDSATAEKAALAAEQWRKTYADLQLEIDKLNPTMDKHQQKVAEISNKYNDLMNKKGANIIKLKELQASLLAATQAHEDAAKAAEAHKLTMSDVSSGLDKFDATFKSMLNLQPDSGLSALSQQIAAFQEIADTFPSQAENVAAAIENLKQKFNESSGLTGLQKNNSDMQIDQIGDEFQRQQAALDAEYNSKKAYYEKEIKLAKDNADKKAALEKGLALTKQKYDGDSVKNTDAAFKSQLSMVANYAATGAQLFRTMADAQDQASREGFEAAKDYNLAAAAMSMAAGIIGAFAGNGTMYEKIANAAIVVATGVAQIAAINATSFGGGSVSAPSGSFGGGSSPVSQSSIGTSIGSQYSSIQDSQTQESLLAVVGSMENASLAIGRVADGLTDIATLFTSGSFLSLAAGAAPGQQTGLTSSGGVSFTKWLGGAINPIGQAIKAIQSGNASAAVQMFDPISAWVTRSIFGGGWNTTGAGLGLSMSGGRASAYDFTEQKKDGGWFGSDKSRTDYQANATWSAIVQTSVDSITSTISRAVVAMGTKAAFNLANVPLTNISTVGRSSDDIAKDLEAWLTNAAGAMAKTVLGLQEFTFYNENAFDALIRLSTALQSTNEAMELIGGTLISSTLAGANSAYKLQELMGGTEAFTDAIDTYFTSMFDDDEQKARTAAQASRQVSVAFAEMGKAVPPTKAAFRSLVDSLDISTESGAQTFAALMKISEAFGTVQDQADSLAKSMADMLNDAFADAANTMAKAMDAAKSQLQATLNTAQSATSILLGLSSATSSPESQYLATKKAFESAVASKDTAAILRIANDYSTQSKAYNASGAGYVSDIEAIKRALEPLTGADKADMSFAELQAHTTYLQEISNSLNGNGSLNTSIVGLRADLAAYNNAKEAAKAGAQLAYDNKVLSAAGAMSALTGSQSLQSLSGSINSMVSGATANPFGFTSTMGQLATDVLNGTGSASDLQAVINSQISKYFAESITNLTSYGGSASAPSLSIPTLARTDSEVAAIAAEKARVASDNAIAAAAGSMMDIWGYGKIGHYAYEMSMGRLPADMRFDIAPNGGDGIVDAKDAQMWHDIGTGIYKYSQVTQKPACDLGILAQYEKLQGLPTFARGGVSNRPSIFGEAGWEAAVPLPDGRSIPVTLNGKIDNSELIAEVKALREEVRAGVRVQQAGFGGLIEINESQDNRLQGVESKVQFAEAA